MAYIYKITNLINDEFYIGQTISSLEHRFSQHKTYARNGGETIFARAIRKYGEENFIIESLEICEEIELDEKETFYIKTLKPKYNIKQEANGRIETTWNNHEIKMYTLKGEFIQDFNSILMASKWLVQNEKSESKNPYTLVSHICDVCSGKRKTAYGFIWRYVDNDFPIVLSDKNKQNIQQKVIMYFPDGRVRNFNSQSSCADFIIQNNLLEGTKKIISTGISNCCLGKRKQYRGFKFNYV